MPWDQIFVVLGGLLSLWAAYKGYKTGALKDISGWFKASTKKGEQIAHDVDDLDALDDELANTRSNSNESP